MRSRGPRPTPSSAASAARSASVRLARCLGHPRRMAGDATRPSCGVCPRSRADGSAGGDDELSAGTYCGEAGSCMPTRRTPAAGARHRDPSRLSRGSTHQACEGGASRSDRGLGVADNLDVPRRGTRAARPCEGAWSAGHRRQQPRSEQPAISSAARSQASARRDRQAHAEGQLPSPGERVYRPTTRELRDQHRHSSCIAGMAASSESMVIEMVACPRPIICAPILLLCLRPI